MHISDKGNRRPSNFFPGFTIVELLIVIVVIGILATISIVAYNGVQQKARDSSIVSDIHGLGSLESQYGVINSTAGKDWYSGDGIDSSLNFRPSPGNVIDVVTNSKDYCIRAYNPGAATYKSLATAATRESSSGACATLLASAAAIVGVAAGGGGAPNPVTTVADNFNRTAVTLGVTSTNAVAWNALSGSWSTNGTRATTSSADSTNPMAVVDFTHADVDASVDIGTGDALYFRVTDASNWWRLSVNAGSYQYASGSHQVSYQYVSSWSCALSWYSFGVYQGTQPPYSLSYNDSYPYNGSYSQSCSPVYSTGYNTVTDYSTAYTWTLTLQKSVAGVVTTVANSGDLGAAPTHLQVIANGTAITGFCSTTSSGTITQRLTAADGFNQTATKHGIGRGGSTAGSSGIDNFSLIQP